MTPIQYQAVYARADREAARQYRIQLDSWLERREDDCRREDNFRRKDSHTAEIAEPQRQALLSDKAISESRQVLHS